MASGDRNYDIATETTQQELLRAVDIKKATKIEQIEPSSGSTTTKTGKGKLYIDPNGAAITLSVDGVSLIEGVILRTPFEVEFAESFSLTRGNTNTSINAVAVYYE